MGVDIGCATGVIATTRPFEAEGAWEFGSFRPELSRAILSFDCRDTWASHVPDMPSDRDFILNFIAYGPEADVGKEPPVTHPRYQSLNQTLRRLSAGAWLREAAFS